MTVVADTATLRGMRAAGAARAARLCLLSLLLAAVGCSENSAPGTQRADRGDISGDDKRTATPALDAGIDDSFVIAPPTLSSFTGDLPAMRERGVLRALVVPSRTDFFLDHGAVKGIQAEYLRELERFLNRDVTKEIERIRIQYVPTPFAELIPALQAGRGDVVAAFDFDRVPAHVSLLVGGKRARGRRDGARRPAIKQQYRDFPGHRWRSPCDR